MPRITLKVTDPRNGQLHEIDAKQIDQVSNSNPAATGRTSADAADGKIDLFVRSESNWSGISTKHLQIDAGRLSSEQAAAIKSDKMPNSETMVDGEEIPAKGTMSTRSHPCTAPPTTEPTTRAHSTMDIL